MDECSRLHVTISSPSSQGSPVITVLMPSVVLEVSSTSSADAPMSPATASLASRSMASPLSSTSTEVGPL